MGHSEKKSIIEAATLSHGKVSSSNISSYFFVADTSGITRKKFK
jgi:hypothetical protein